MTDLSLTSPTVSAATSSKTPTAATAIKSNVLSDEVVPQHSPPPDDSHHDAPDDLLLLLNPALRRQFVFYTTSASVTNLETMTRSSFIKFVHDCDLHVLPSLPLTEAELVNIFAKACGTSKLMTFKQWITAIQLVLHRGFPGQVRCADHTSYV